MLVLSRNEGEGIAVPDLDLAIRVLRVAGGRIQLGIQAPKYIRVLRSELIDRAKHVERDSMTPSARHEFRNRLNHVSLALTIAEKHLERGDATSAESALQDALTHMVAEIEWSPPQSIPVVCPRLSALLVDDNRNESSLLAEVLRLSGIDVQIACNGLEALEELNHRIPQVILLDMYMPECDGPTTIRKIRSDSRFRDIPVYAVTGSAANDINIRHGKNGIRRWFQKPVQVTDLVQAILDESTTCQPRC